MSQSFPYSGAAHGKWAASPHYVMLATPIAEKPCTSYTVSLAATAQTLTIAGVRFDIETLTGCCHVDDARNIIIRNFLQSDCTDLFFIDADLGWQPNNVLRLLKAPGDIVGGVYCHKSDDATFPFHPFEGQTTTNAFGLFPMPKAATGFLRIRRPVLEALYEREKAKERLLWLDGDSAQLNRLPVARICERGFVRELGLQDLNANEASQSGDYVLCLKARSLGFNVYIDPDMAFSHCGEKIWTGHFGNHLRKQQGAWQQQFIDAVEELRGGSLDRAVIDKLAASYGVDGWPLFPEALHALYLQAKGTRGHVLETGAGLSTLVLGLALGGTQREVHALEHDAHWWRETRRMLEAFNVSNVVLHYAPLVPCDDGTAVYALESVQLPERFGLALIDGPPARYAGRPAVTAMLKDRLAEATVIVDDVEGTPDVLTHLTAHKIEMRQGRRQWAVATPPLVMRHSEIRTEAAE